MHHALPRLRVRTADCEAKKPIMATDFAGYSCSVLRGPTGQRFVITIVTGIRQ